MLADDRLQLGPRVGRPERNRRVLIHLRSVPGIADRHRLRGRDRLIDFAERVVFAGRLGDLDGVQTGRARFLAVRLRIEEQVRLGDRVDVGACPRRAARHRRDGGQPAILP